MIYGSVCSGIEAASVAWGPLGWRPAWFAEIDPFCSALLRQHYPEVENRGDFTGITNAAGPIDVLVGGTPCQSFSVAGGRAGLDDARGNLTLEFLELAGRLRPRWVVWENVPGVLSIDGGRTFGAVLGRLGQLGYGVAYRVLDAQFFGVPQRRRRVFVVGYLGDWRRAAAVLFEPESLCRYPPARRKARQESSDRSGSGAEVREGWIPEVAPTLNAGKNATGGDRFPGTSVDTCDSLIVPSFVPEVSFSLNAKGGAGRIDGESDTFVSTFQNTGQGWWNQRDVAQSIRSSSGGGSYEANVVAHSLRADGFDASEDGTGRGTPIVAVPILEAGARTGKSTTDVRAGIGIGKPGDPMFTLQSGKQHAIAFSGKDHGADAGETAPTLRAMGHDGSHANGGGQVAVCGWNGDVTPKAHTGVMPTMRADQGGEGYGVQQGRVVRRLTPMECERLQGFPDGYTAIQYRGKPAADGPRYRAIGNSFAVPVVRWIGERIAMVDGLSQAPECGDGGK